MSPLQSLGAALVMAGFIVGIVKAETSGVMILVGFVVIGSEMFNGRF